MPSAPYDAVIVDCDGCLVETEAIAVDMEIAALAALGLHYEREPYIHAFLGGTASSWQATIDAACRETLGTPLPDTFHSELNEAIRRAYAERLGPVEGALEAISRLRGRKAVASSSSDQHLRLVLEHTGLWAAFDPHIYSAHSVERGKPAPDVYLYAAAKLQVPASRCLAIEDSVNGVRAAVAAGMTVWGFTGGTHLSGSDGRHLLEAGASEVLRTWDEGASRFAGWQA